MPGIVCENQLTNVVSVFLLVVLMFEMRALGLLGMCFTTSGTALTTFAFAVFQIESCHLCLGQPRWRFSCLPFQCSWDNPAF
jgi:hypothetical protein